MPKTTHRNLVSGKGSTRSASSGRFVSRPYSRGAKVEPTTDVDLVGAVPLTTPQQVQRLGKLKQRVDAAMKTRGMRDSA